MSPIGLHQFVSTICVIYHSPGEHHGPALARPTAATRHITQYGNTTHTAHPPIVGPETHVIAVCVSYGTNASPSGTSGLFGNSAFSIIS